MKRSVLLAVALVLPIASIGVAQVDSAASLLESPVKLDPPTYRAGETVHCTLPLPGSLFGTDSIIGSDPVEFLTGELFGSFSVFHHDEDCMLMISWFTALPGPTQTGITWDDCNGTYWAVDPNGTASIVEFAFGTGVPTGASVPLAGGSIGLWGPAALDYHQVSCSGPAFKPCYIEDIASDVVVEHDLATGAIGCSFPNPDNAGGGGAFGNGISKAGDAGACSGATLYLSSGTIAEGQVTRVSQIDCSGSFCPDVWDVATPLLPFGETFVNGIATFGKGNWKLNSNPPPKWVWAPDSSPTSLTAVGNATGTVYILRQPIGVANCQGADSPDSDVLYANASQGGPTFTVAIDNTLPLGLAIQRPPAGGNGKYVVHLDGGIPTSGTITTLPASLGAICFPFLLPPAGTASPAAVWNNLGKTSRVGASNYFGTSIPDPAKAPAFFHQDADGDPVNLTLGSRWTLQGIVVNPTGSSPKFASVTNAVILDVTAGL